MYWLRLSDAHSHLISYSHWITYRHVFWLRTSFYSWRLSGALSLLFLILTEVVHKAICWLMVQFYELVEVERPSLPFYFIILTQLYIYSKYMQMVLT